MSKVLGWAVVYMPSRNGKLFANLNSEIVAAFASQEDAERVKDSYNEGGYIDELHVGYRVYPMHFIPKGVTIR